MSYAVNPEVEFKYLTEIVLLAIQRHSKGNWVGKAATLKNIPVMQHWTLDEILITLQKEGLIQITKRGEKQFIIRSLAKKKKVKEPDELRGIRRLVLNIVEKYSQGKWISSKETLEEFPAIHHLECDDTLFYLVDKGLIRIVPTEGDDGFFIRSTTAKERKAR